MAGIPGSFWLNKFREGGSTQLALLLGSVVDFPDPPAHQDERRYYEHCAMAMWMLNKTSINYLWACWCKRKSIVGTLQIKAGRLVRTKPDNAVQQQAETTNDIQAPEGFRRYWASWLPQILRKKTQPSNGSKTGTRNNFDKVWRGRRKGVFYKWSHCRSSIAGSPEPGLH